jgi:hypothetical protein
MNFEMIFSKNPEFFPVLFVHICSYLNWSLGHYTWGSWALGHLDSLELELLGFGTWALGNFGSWELRLLGTWA